MNRPADAPGANGHAATAAAVLCALDAGDELAALRTLLETNGYKILVAHDGAAAMEAQRTERVDVVFAGKQLAGRDGALLLQQVQARWPHTQRFLLTDPEHKPAALEAADRGAVSRPVVRPWDDAELLLLVRDAVARGALEREKKQLEALALRRADELKALNASLEQNVSASQDELAAANDRLKNNFVVSLKVFSSLVESRRPHLAGHSRRVADLARKLATRLGLEAALVQEVFVAGLLHDVGKLAFTDELLDTPVASMNTRQLQEFRKHPARAEELLMPLQDLRGAAASIGMQLERFDGAGYPNQLQGRAILVGARILAVCADYHNLLIGTLAPKHLTSKEAVRLIIGLSGKRYDPWVIEAFVALMGGKMPTAQEAEALDPHEMRVDAATLVQGMELARDLVAPSGLMMLSANNKLDERLIQKVLDFERSSGTPLTIYIKKDESAAADPPAGEDAPAP